MSKPVEDSKILIVVNRKEQLDRLLEDKAGKINTIILNDNKVEELINVLQKSKEKSSKYHYLLCMANNTECINEMVILMEFMRDNSFSYSLSETQIKMYQETLRKGVDEHE